ncbi:hypothetical protein C0J52_25508 [Blattella germanica]|nr:hypothetical protein C0J52_25508 [Blattella germanica]
MLLQCISSSNSCSVIEKVIKVLFTIRVAAFSFGKSIYVVFPESHRLHAYSKLGAQLPLGGSKSRPQQLLCMSVSSPVALR